MKRLRKLVAAAFFMATLALPSGAQGQQWIVLGDEVAEGFARSLAQDQSIDPEQAAGFTVTASNAGRVIAQIDPSLETRLHEVVHIDYHRCGGYTIHPTEEAARAELENPNYDPEFLARRGIAPQIDQQSHVGPAIALVDPAKIVHTIEWMQGIGTRYYQSAAGQTAAETLKAQWDAYAADRADFSVALYDHTWNQDSVVATITGSGLPQEIVVIGAHLDSINPSNTANAPGADDDASGVAVISEALRVMLASGFRPRRTVQFIAYAAEEVGLRGSRAIASAYGADPTKNVVAALQMDMTGFAGSANDLYFVTDYVSEDVNTFLKDLIVEYNSSGPHAITYGETACGYACSDHAAWTGEGVPAAFPFEARFEDYNTEIHTSGDLLSAIDDSGDKQAKFAKLSIEFAMEVAKSASAPPDRANGPIGFVWANNPTAASYDPSPTYAYNGAGGAISVARTGAGVYRLKFAGLGGNGRAGGSVQVTSYGAGAHRCKVRSWGSSGIDFVVSVRCYDPGGELTDGQYTALVIWPPS
jgi:leucyl aminopeptidase